MLTLKKKDFYACNSLSLCFLAGVFWIKSDESSFIYWPGAYLLSIWILSTIFYQLHASRAQWTFLVLYGCIFAISHWFLTNALILVLERFFRIQEHFTLSDFPRLIHHNWTLCLDGLIWFGAYLLVLSYLDQSTKLRSVEERNQELEKELNTTSLNSLRKEINPHFLFNAMNGIAMKVRLKENKVAVSMIVALNDLLRLSLTKSNDELIPIYQELALLDNYLLIEKHRFGEQAMIDIDFPEEIRLLKVPELILQPLVENAFKHGFNQDENLQQIRISGQLMEQQLKLSVYNTRSGISNFNFARSGVGLPNIVHRLRRIYQTDFKFQSFSEEHGIAFTITLPIRP